MVVSRCDVSRRTVSERDESVAHAVAGGGGGGGSNSSDTSIEEVSEG